MAYPDEISPQRTAIEEHRSNRTMMIVMGVIAVAAIIVLGLFFMNRDQVASQTATDQSNAAAQQQASQASVDAANANAQAQIAAAQAQARATQAASTPAPAPAPVIIHDQAPAAAPAQPADQAGDQSQQP